MHLLEISIFSLHFVRPTKIMNRAHKNWAHFQKIKLTSFSEKMFIYNRCLCGLMPNLIKKSVTVSNVASPSSKPFLGNPLHSILIYCRVVTQTGDVAFVFGQSGLRGFQILVLGYDMVKLIHQHQRLERLLNTVHTAWIVNDVLVDLYPFFEVKRGMDRPIQKCVWIDQDVIDLPHCMLSWI